VSGAAGGGADGGITNVPWIDGGILIAVGALRAQDINIERKPVMKALCISLFAFGAAAALGVSPWGAAKAQADPALAPPPAVTAAPPAAAQGDWTLRQREDWLSDQLKSSLANGAVDKAEFNRARLEMDHLRQEESRMRHDGKGDLTDNQTSDLEARLDTMADKIHWANTYAYKRPW